MKNYTHHPKSSRAQAITSQYYFQEIHSQKTLDKEEEVRLAKLACQGDQKAYDQLITANLKFVIKIAHQYKNRGLDFMDLVSEGNLGLMHALDKFEVERGFRFSTYAGWWVRQYIERAIMTQSRTVRIPPNVIKSMYRASKQHEVLSHAQERTVTCKELAEHMNEDFENIQTWMKLLPGGHSLDTPLGHDSATTHRDLLAAEENYTPQHMATCDHNGSLIDQWLEDFPEDMRAVIIRRFGLHQKRPMTLEAIADELNIAREKVRQLQLRGVKRLRQVAEKKGINSLEDIAVEG